MRTVTEVAKSIVITPIQMELEVEYNLLISHENREEKNTGYKFRTLAKQDYHSLL